MDDALIRIAAQHVPAAIDGCPDQPAEEAVKHSCGDAQLEPARQRTWRRSSEIQFLCTGPADPDWAVDRDAVDGSVTDPFDITQLG